ncbi:MAG: bacteriohemerythrin [Myxococcota bacterium]
MPLMDWDDKLSVGVKQIDDEHKHLIKLVNELHDAIRANHGKEVLGKVLDGLIAYTGSHFGHEEAEMKRTAYPQAQAHFAEHAALVKKVLAIQEQYKAGKAAVLGMETLAFLRDWLVKHIKGTDQALGAYLKVHGGKKVA